MTPPSALPVVAVRARHRSIRPDGFVTEIDPRLPDSVVGRTVYHCPDERYLALPHRHDATHDLLCLVGSCAVGWIQEGEHRVTWTEMGPGDQLHIPRGLAHRLWLGAGAVVASVSLAVNWLASGGFEELPAGEGWQR